MSTQEPHHPHQHFKEAMLGEVGQRFLSEFFARQRPWHRHDMRPERFVRYIPLNEFPFSVPGDKKDSLGRPTANTRRLDMVLYVASGRDAAYHQDCFSIGIEMKGSWNDLWRDHKMQHYLGKTDFLYLAVPDWLAEEALSKASRIEGLGVFSLTSGAIFRVASKQEVVPVIRDQMLFRALFKPESAVEFWIDKAFFEGIPCPTPSADAGSQPGNAQLSAEESTNHKTTTAMNFVGNRTAEEVRRTRLELKNGKLCMWQGQDQPILEFDYAEGRLLGIETRRRTTSKGEMIYCDFHFVNCGEFFDISTIASSCVTADFVGRLSNVRDIVNSVLRIDAWKNNQYTNINIRENGAPVPFLRLPRVQKVDKGFKVEPDSSERDAAVMRLIEEINGRLHDAPARPEQNDGGQAHPFSGPEEF